MAYSEEILSRAEALLKKAQSAHAAGQEAQRKEIYQKLPRTAEIDRNLRRLAPRILALSLQGGAEREAALSALRRENLSLQEEEARLLAQNGYPADALQNKPLCPLCSDRGWRGAVMCDCLKTLCQREQTRALSSLLDLQGQSFETFRLDCYPPSVQEKMNTVRSVCQNYATQFRSFPRKNLFLYGAPGLGKTFLSACIARVVAEAGFSVVYDSAPTVFSRFEARKFTREPEELRLAEQDARRYLSCDLLILDDLGSEFTTPFVQAALYEVVNTRLAERKHTVISSNLTPAAIRQRYSPQIASRLEGEYGMLEFAGEDIRLWKKRAGQGKTFPPR